MRPGTGAVPLPGTGHTADLILTPADNDDRFAVVVCRCGWMTKNPLLSGAFAELAEHLHDCWDRVQPAEPQVQGVLLGCGHEGSVLAPSFFRVTDPTGARVICACGMVSCLHGIVTEAGQPCWELSACPVLSEAEYERYGR